MHTFTQQLEQLDRQNQRRRIRPTPACRLNCSSNDYLGLASDTQLQAEFFSNFPTDCPPFGSTSSRLLTGDSAHHQALEHTLSIAYQRPALLFNSGYHANIGILPALADARTLILADKLVHASLIDGIRLSGAAYKRFPHNNIERLTAMLAQYAEHYQRIIIVTESIFSMDGDFAPLAELAALKQSYPHILLYLDEAHAVGICGTQGLGLAEQQNCLADIDILVGTFGKAAASIGAYVICNEVLHDFLINHARPFIFGTSRPPINAAWSNFIFQHFAAWQDKRQHLANISAHLRQAIARQGLPMPSQSNVVPYITGSNQSAEQLSAALQSQGCYALPIRPPTVPAGSARIRFSLTAAMSTQDIDWLISLLPSPRA